MSTGKELERQTAFFSWVDNSLKENQDITLEYNIDSVLVNWEIIDNKINSELASSLWGKDYGYYMRLELDMPFKSALENFDLAKELAK